LQKFNPKKKMRIQDESGRILCDIDDLPSYSNDGPTAGGTQDKPGPMNFFPISYHDPADCPICNINKSGFIKVNPKLVNVIKNLVKKYACTHDRNIVDNIQTIYRDNVKRPADKIIQSGVCSDDISHYPEITRSEVLSHCDVFSTESSLLKVFKYIDTRQTNYRDNIIKEDGSVDEQLRRLFQEDVKMMMMISKDLTAKQQLNKKRSKKKENLGKNTF